LKPLAVNPTRMRRSGIREINDLARTMSEVLHLEVGEPNFNTPRHIVEAAHQAALDGWTKYTASAGIPSLRQAIAAKVEAVNGFHAPPEQIVVTHGAVSGLMNVSMALLDPGDELLLPDPGWPNCEMMALTLGARPVRYPLLAEHDFLPRLEDLEPLVSARTKALLINSPANPTGAVFPEPLVRELVAFARRHDLWLISDECYDQIVYDGAHTSPARFDTEGRVISSFSFSKTYAMTGWRIGYTVAPPGVVELMLKLQEPVISCASSVSQKAAEAALLGPQECVEEMRASYHLRRDAALAVLRAAGFSPSIPRGAFYVMVDVSAATEDSYEFARGLLKNRRVAVAPGEAFGPSGRGLVRVSLATEQSILEEGLRRLAAEVAERSAVAARA
jgi:aspartate/methionine/tyrosine aminotransferase